MSEFVSCSVLSDEAQPIERAQLRGDGWYIEMHKVDEHTVAVRAGGSMSVLMSVLPRASNLVYVTTDVELSRRVHEEAKQVADVWKRNEESTMRKPSRKPKQ